jgi:hypothetical protein
MPVHWQLGKGLLTVVLVAGYEDRDLKAAVAEALLQAAIQIGSAREGPGEPSRR